MTVNGFRRKVQYLSADIVMSQLQKKIDYFIKSGRQVEVPKCTGMVGQCQGNKVSLS